MSKFKIGDRVKIPTRKSRGCSLQTFTYGELPNKKYSKDYLIVKEVDIDNIGLIRLAFDDISILDIDIWSECDLDPYEGEMGVEQVASVDVPLKYWGLTEPHPVKSNNEEEKLEEEKGIYEWTHDFNADSKCDTWKRLIFAYADDNDYNAVKEIAALAEKLK